jgi:ATP-dependent helicase Lhr and Lhr-like helicase
LRRWGVVFRDLLVKEPGAPGWYELSQVYRRLEARGEIRGGRFVAGVGGEQFATADAVGQLRSLRDEAPQGELVIVSAADPTNLVGILNDDVRIPSTASNRVAYFDGAPVAMLKSQEIVFLAEVPESTAESIRAAFGQPSRHAAKIESPGLEPQPLANDTTPQPKEAAPRARRSPRPPSGIPRPLIR